MRRIVLDTNVLVSGLINPFGAPGRIVDTIREAAVELSLDDRILAEYCEVLHRPKFERYFGPADVRDILSFLQNNTHYVVSVSPILDLPDPEDTPFLEVALAAHIPLVTGNIAHFPEDKRRGAIVLTPTGFLQELAV